MHPHHALIERMAGRYTSEPKQGGRHRDLGLLGEIDQDLHRSRHHDSVPGQDDRSLSFFDQLQRVFVLFGQRA